MHDAEDCHPILGCRFGDLYDQTMERMHQLRSLGLHIVYIWQRDFVHWEKHGRFASLPVHVMH